MLFVVVLEGLMVSLSARVSLFLSETHSLQEVLELISWFVFLVSLSFDKKCLIVSRRSRSFQLQTCPRGSWSNATGSPWVHHEHVSAYSCKFFEEFVRGSLLSLKRRSRFNPRVLYFFSVFFSDTALFDIFICLGASSSNSRDYFQDKFNQLMSQMPQLRLLTMRGEEFLYFKHLGGSAPTQTLLMEMLHAKRKWSTELKEHQDSPSEHPFGYSLWPRDLITITDIIASWRRRTSQDNSRRRIMMGIMNCVQQNVNVFVPSQKGCLFSKEF